MAIVQLDSGVDPFFAREKGSIFYVRNGRQVVRNRVVPCFPATTPQLKDVNGIAMASHAWKSVLTPAELASWSTPCFWGWPGSPWLQAIWSIINWIFDSLPPASFSGFCPPPLCSTSYNFTPATGVMNVTTGADLSYPFAGYVAATPPLPDGRVPRPEMSRVLAIGVSPGATIDIGPAYLARFGVLPTGGQIGIQSRFADPFSGSATEPCFVVYQAVPPTPNLVASVITVPQPLPYPSVGHNNVYWSDSSGLTTSVKIVLALDPTFFGGGTWTGVTTSPFSAVVGQPGHVPGSYACLCSVTSEQTLQTVNVPFTIVTT